MSEDCPAGYITMTAAEITHGCHLYLADLGAKQKAWDEDLIVKVVAYAKTKSWLWRYWNNGLTTDPAEAKEWYRSFTWDYPDVPGLGKRPPTSGAMVDWAARAVHLEPETKVFINITDAAAIKSWIKKGTA